MTWLTLASPPIFYDRPTPLRACESKKRLQSTVQSLSLRLVAAADRRPRLRAPWPRASPSVKCKRRCRAQRSRPGSPAVGDRAGVRAWRRRRHLACTGRTTGAPSDTPPACRPHHRQNKKHSTTADKPRDAFAQYAWMWVPDHSNVTGNEIAKQAANLGPECREPFIGTSQKMVRINTCSWADKVTYTPSHPHTHTHPHTSWQSDCNIRAAVLYYVVGADNLLGPNSTALYWICVAPFFLFCNVDCCTVFMKFFFT